MDLNLDAPHSMGTTIIGVTYNGGVILGADSCANTGMYVANRASDKITQLTDNVYVYRSGSLLRFLYYVTKMGHELFPGCLSNHHKANLKLMLVTLGEKGCRYYTKRCKHFEIGGDKKGNWRISLF